MAYYINPTGLQYSFWPRGPVTTPQELDRYCPCTADSSWLTQGCEYRAQYHAKPGGRSVACKNGVPYDCRCNLIQRPFSMPYEARWEEKPGCDKGPGVWYVRPPYFMKQT